MKVVQNFLYILGAALFSAILGSVFGVLIAVISPEFARECLFTGVDQIVRYSAATGLLAGLFIGAGAMAFCLLIGAIAGKRGQKQTEVQK